MKEVLKKVVEMMEAGYTEEELLQALASGKDTVDEWRAAEREYTKDEARMTFLKEQREKEVESKTTKNTKFISQGDCALVEVDEED